MRRKPGIPLLHRSPIRLPLTHTLQPRQNRRILLQPKRPEQPHGRHTKHTQQIRHRELLARQPCTLRNAVLQQLQQLLRHGLQPHTNRVRRRQAREAEHHVAADARQRGAVAKVQPVEVVGVVGRVGRDLQLVAAVLR